MHLQAIFHYTLQEYFENFHVVVDHKCCSIWVSFYLNCPVSKPYHVKVQSSLHILKVLLLFLSFDMTDFITCFIFTTLILFLAGNLIFSFWYWVYLVLLLPHAFTFDCRFEFWISTVPATSKTNPMRFHWDYFHHPLSESLFLWFEGGPSTMSTSLFTSFWKSKASKLSWSSLNLHF